MEWIAERSTDPMNIKETVGMSDCSGEAGTGESPRIETERLLLRKPKPEDAEAVLSLIQQPFVRRYNCFREQPSLKEAEDMLNRDPENQFVICLKKTGKVIGHIGMEEDSLRYRVGSVSLDYFLGEEYARKGYMSEALRSVIAFLFHERRAEIISARAFSENTASIALLQKLGFAREGMLRSAVRNFEDKTFDDVLFSLLKTEYEAMRPASPRIGDTVTIRMDRPIGTEHPKHPGLIYSINYGYVPGLIAPDGEEQDAYVLGVDVPLTEFTGRLIAIIHRFDDVEEKWVLAPEGMTFTKDEIAEAVHFQEQYYHTEIRVEEKS